MLLITGLGPSVLAKVKALEAQELLNKIWSTTTKTLSHNTEGGSLKHSDDVQELIERIFQASNIMSELTSIERLDSSSVSLTQSLLMLSTICVNLFANCSLALKRCETIKNYNELTEVVLKWTTYTLNYLKFSSGQSLHVISDENTKNQPNSIKITLLIDIMIISISSLVIINQNIDDFRVIGELAKFVTETVTSARVALVQFQSTKKVFQTLCHTEVLQPMLTLCAYYDNLQNQKSLNITNNISPDITAAAREVIKLIKEFIFEEKQLLDLAHSKLMFQELLNPTEVREQLISAPKESKSQTYSLALFDTLVSLASSSTTHDSSSQISNLFQMFVSSSHDMAVSSSKQVDNINLTQKSKKSHTRDSDNANPDDSADRLSISNRRRHLVRIIQFSLAVVCKLIGYQQSNLEQPSFLARLSAANSILFRLSISLGGSLPNHEDFEKHRIELSNLVKINIKLLETYVHDSSKLDEAITKECLAMIAHCVDVDHRVITSSVDESPSNLHHVLHLCNIMYKNVSSKDTAQGGSLQNEICKFIRIIVKHHSDLRSLDLFVSILLKYSVDYDIDGKFGSYPSILSSPLVKDVFYQAVLQSPLSQMHEYWQLLADSELAVNAHGSSSLINALSPILSSGHQQLIKTSFASSSGSQDFTSLISSFESIGKLLDLVLGSLSSTQSESYRLAACCGLELAELCTCIVSNYILDRSAPKKTFLTIIDNIKQCQQKFRSLVQVLVQACINCDDLDKSDISLVFLQTIIKLDINVHCHLPVSDKSSEERWDSNLAIASLKDIGIKMKSVQLTSRIEPLGEMALVLLNNRSIWENLQIFTTEQIANWLEYLLNIQNQEEYDSRCIKLCLKDEEQVLWEAMILILEDEFQKCLSSRNSAPNTNSEPKRKRQRVENSSQSKVADPLKREIPSQMLSRLISLTPLTILLYQTPSSRHREPNNSSKGCITLEEKMYKWVVNTLSNRHEIDPQFENENTITKVIDMILVLLRRSSNSKIFTSTHFESLNQLIIASTESGIGDVLLSKICSLICLIVDLSAEYSKPEDCIKIMQLVIQLYLQRLKSQPSNTKTRLLLKYESLNHLEQIYQCVCNKLTFIIEEMNITPDILASCEVFLSDVVSQSTSPRLVADSLRVWALLRKHDLETGNNVLCALTESMLRFVKKCLVGDVDYEAMFYLITCASHAIHYYCGCSWTSSAAQGIFDIFMSASNKSDSEPISPQNSISIIDLALNEFFLSIRPSDIQTIAGSLTKKTLTTIGDRVISCIAWKNCVIRYLNISQPTSEPSVDFKVLSDYFSVIALDSSNSIQLPTHCLESSLLVLECIHSKVSQYSLNSKEDSLSHKLILTSVTGILHGLSTISQSIVHSLLNYDDCDMLASIELFAKNLEILVNILIVRHFMMQNTIIPIVIQIIRLVSVAASSAAALSIHSNHRDHEKSSAIVTNIMNAVIPRIFMSIGKIRILGQHLEIIVALVIDMFSRMADDISRLPIYEGSHRVINPSTYLTDGIKYGIFQMFDHLNDGPKSKKRIFAMLALVSPSPAAREVYQDLTNAYNTDYKFIGKA